MGTGFVVVAALLSADPEKGAEKPRRAVVVSSLVKVRPGALPRGDVRAELSAAQGECEAFQVLVPPPAKRVTAAAPVLTFGTSKVPLRIFREAYVPVTTPSNSEGATGLWPDALIPEVDAYAKERRRALPFDSTAERPLVLWAEACVPEKTAPGRYEGRLALRDDAGPLEDVPVSLTVHPFSLPATSSLPNSFGLSIYSLAKGHRLSPQKDDGALRKLLFRYGQAALSHRVSLHGMGMEAPPLSFERGEPKIDFTGYDAELSPFYDGTALPSGARFTTVDVRDSSAAKTDEEKARYFRAVVAHLEEKGVRARPFFYAKDEPKPKDVPLVLAQSKRARAASLPVLVTAPYDDTLSPAADILTPVLNCFFPRSGASTCDRVNRAQALKAKRKGAPVWWYQSCMSHGCGGGPSEDREVEAAFTGWASYMVDHPAPLNRAMGPLAFAEGVDGELYFDTVFAYNTRDPWEGVFEFGGNGDGTLFYPGDPSRIGGETPVPIESLRLKQIRDGLEDFEYLSLLGKKDPALARRLAAKLARSGHQIERDPAVWAQVRQEITRAITGGRPTVE